MAGYFDSYAPPLHLQNALSGTECQFPWGTNITRLWHVGLSQQMKSRLGYHAYLIQISTETRIILLAFRFEHTNILHFYQYGYNELKSFPHKTSKLLHGYTLGNMLAAEEV